MDKSLIDAFYEQWKKDTKRNGAILIGGSIKELLTDFAKQFKSPSEAAALRIVDELYKRHRSVLKNLDVSNEDKNIFLRKLNISTAEFDNH